MSGRHSVCFVLMAFVVVPAAARADYHNADANGRYSGSDGGSKVHGFGLGIIKEMSCPNQPTTPQPPEKCKRSYVGFGGDVSAHFGSHETKPETEVTFLGEARFTLPEHWDRGLVYTQAFLGGTTKNDGIAHHTNWATGVGLAMDFCLKHPRADTADHFAPLGWALRAQLDYIRDLGSDEKARNVARWGFGLAYRFGHVPAESGR